MTPVHITYLENGEKVHVSILGQFAHHFTGTTIYKIRREGESGWVGEDLYFERALLLLLNMRIEDSSNDN